MTQILITIPDGAFGIDASIVTIKEGDYVTLASAMGRNDLKNAVDATREATRYYQTALRSKNAENGGSL